MSRINEIVDDFMKHWEADYVGLWNIASTIRRDIGIRGGNIVREKSLEVVRGLLQRGLYPGNFVNSEFRFWDDMSIDRVLARIDREWKALEHDPDLAEPICWFDRRPLPPR